jgi:aspartyl-tRNA(Asn)/glutamyl-tRNA(Gln) amidotransferase subunit C
MQVDDKLVDHLATLARLEFTGEAKETIKKDLTQMLDFVEQLNRVNLDGVEPLVYITDAVNVLRNDAVEEHLTHEQAMANVPLKNSDYIKVPKVLSKTPDLRRKTMRHNYKELKFSRKVERLLKTFIPSP